MGTRPHGKETKGLGATPPPPAPAYIYVFLLFSHANESVIRDRYVRGGLLGGLDSSAINAAPEHNRVVKYSSLITPTVAFILV